MASMQAEKKAVLSARCIAVKAGEKTLISGLSLALRPGEVVALTGPSGCGKTTLLRALAGLADPASGTVHFKGGEAGRNGWPVYRRQVLLVTQKPVLCEGSVEENLRRPFTYRHAPGPFPRDRALAWLKQLRLDGGSFLGARARDLSVGEQQRVCLVRALLLEPAVLLLDEPTSALDAKVVLEVEEVLREEAHVRGLAALMVTHHREQAVRCCDREIDLAPWLYREAGK